MIEDLGDLRNGDMRVCLTGGAGFIGSHILAELLAERHEVLVIDNFANNSTESLQRVNA